MSQYRVIGLIDGKYALQDMEDDIFGQWAVLLRNGSQFMPENTSFNIDVGKFKVIWMTDNWVGMARTNGNKKINGNDSVYVSHVQKNGSYIFVKEYPKVASIEAYFEILDYYQNFDSANYADLMLNLANTLAYVRDTLGVNEFVNNKYHMPISGMSTQMPTEELEPVHDLTLSKLHELTAKQG